MKVTIELDEQQAGAVIRALDLYSRIAMGQLEAIVDHPEIHDRIMQDKSDTSDILSARDLFSHAKQQLFGLNPNASRGIYNEDVSDDARVAWDIQKVLVHGISWARVGDVPRDWATMGGNNFDTPRRSSSSPLPIVSVVKE